MKVAVDADIDKRDPRLCIAHNRAGALCNKFARRGQRVCRHHGGSSPQALTKAATAVELAELRLRNIAPRAVDVLESLVTSGTSEQVRLQAANSLVDRSVGKATEKIQVAAAITVTRPWQMTLLTALVRPGVIRRLSFVLAVFLAQGACGGDGFGSVTAPSPIGVQTPVVTQTQTWTLAGQVRSLQTKRVVSNAVYSPWMRVLHSAGGPTVLNQPELS